MLVLMLAGVVHSVDLGHAVGQMSEETRSDLSIYTLASGQEASDFIHALAESGTIFSQYSGVSVKGSCRKKHTGIYKLKSFIWILYVWNS